MPDTEVDSPSRATAMPAEARRAAIIEAIGPLLVEHGEMVTTRQIAQAAGVAEGTIFRVFPDKEALLRAALDDALDMADLEEALRAIDRSCDFEVQLVEATDALQRRVEHVWRLVANLGPKLQEHVRRPVTDSDALTELLAAHTDRLTVDPARAARMLRALTLSMTHPMFSGERLPAADIAAFFLDGVGRPS